MFPRKRITQLFWQTHDSEMQLLSKSYLALGQKSAIKCFGLKITPSLERFQKFIRFGTVTRHLISLSVFFA